MIKRVLINHGIVFVLFCGGAALVVLGTAIIFNMVLPASDPESRFLAQVIVLIVWILSWILRGLYISNRDLSIEDMGRVTLGTFIGICEEIYKRKYGGKPLGKQE